ncbi:MAG TPA: DUF58 domain-containing protein [Gaiellaceae bacterium]|nr:DUF58 domain-containing protein [Gaiellaceae bacterium]
MLTDRGRWILALGGGIYLAAWALGSEVLYPVAIGLILAVLAAALWVRILRRPMTLRRTLGRGERLAGDDVPVQLELDAEGLVPSGTLVLREKVARLGEREVPLVRRHGRLRGRYLLRRVPRGRYPVEETEVVIEDPFGLERTTVELPSGASILVYPRLVDVDRLFSESGARTPEGRRLLLRRPTGFDLHSVRDYQQGESLRRVHWPTTARRGQLMVKELEDSPRDETAVLLDADASALVGTAPDSSFELAVRAAGSILKSQASRGRRAALIVNGLRPVYQRVHSFDGDWQRALEILAAVEPDGHSAVANVLADEAGPAARAVELTVVTSALAPRLVERLAHRALGNHPASLVYVDAASFVASPAETPLPPAEAAQILRLQRAGVPVLILRRDDDLAACLSAGELRAVG